MACEDELPPVVNFSECDPVWLVGKVKKVYLALIGQPLAAFADLATRVDNESVEVTAIRMLDVDAALPAPTRTSIPRFNGKVQMSPGEFVLNVDIEDVSDENYAFMQATQYGKSYLMWFECTNGYLYGSLAGIESSLGLELIIPKADTEALLIQGQINWKARTSPQRSVSPLYVPEGTTTTTTTTAP